MAAVTDAPERRGCSGLQPLAERLRGRGRQLDGHVCPWALSGRETRHLPSGFLGCVARGSGHWVDSDWLAATDQGILSWPN